MKLDAVPIVEVWSALGGGPLQGKRAQGFWRGGDGYSVALDPVKGTWYDHRDGRGGGVLALVEIALGSERRAALQWLEDYGFIEPLTCTHQQRREYSQRRAAAATVALNIAHWRSAFTLELNTNKLTAADTGDDEALGCAARLCNVLENGSPEDIVREYIRHRANDLADISRLIATGQACDIEAQRIAVGTVLLLALAAAKDSRDAA